MKLTKYFNLSEVLKTNTGIKNEFETYEQLVNIHWLLLKLDRVRAHFNKPLIISSGFRNKAVNSKVNGSSTSQHMKGEAIDFSIPGVPLKEVYDYIKENIEYDQLIYEFDSWIHISSKLNDIGNRNQSLRAIKENGKTKYISF